MQQKYHNRMLIFRIQTREWILFAIISCSHSSHTCTRAICVWVVDTGINMKIKSFHRFGFFHRRTYGLLFSRQRVAAFSNMHTPINKRKTRRGGILHFSLSIWMCVYYFVAHINFHPYSLQHSAVCLCWRTDA